MQDWVEQELGVAPWVFEGVLLPLLAFLAVLLVRELVLVAFSRGVEDAERRKAWRRRTLWVALTLAIVSAAGASWVRQHSIARSIADGAGEVVEVQNYLGSATKVIVYTLLLLTFALIVQGIYRNILARINAWKPA